MQFQKEVNEIQQKDSLDKIPQIEICIQCYGNTLRW